MRYRVTAVLAAACAVGVLSGCGSSSSSSSHINGQVIRAADTTAQAPGYRMSGTGSVSSSRTGALAMALSGSFDRQDRTGSLTTTVQIDGRRIQIPEVFSQLTVYMSASAIPDAAGLTGGKSWLKIDMSRTLGAIGASSLPTATDPTQFVDYLRAVSSDTTRVGTATIRGVKTTEYRAVVDLDRYPDLVSAAQRPAVARSVKQLEAVLGGHTLPLHVWIDDHSLVRRLGFSFNECEANVKSSFAMTMDLYDYGPQPAPRIPPASSVYDITPLITEGLSHAKLGCT